MRVKKNSVWKFRRPFPFSLRLSAVQLHFVGEGQEKSTLKTDKHATWCTAKKMPRCFKWWCAVSPPAPKWAYSQCRLGESLRGIKINDPCREYITSSSRPHPSFSKNHISGFPRWSPNLRNALKYLCSFEQKARSPIEAGLHVWQKWI